MTRVAVFCLIIGCFAAETMAQCRHTVVAPKGLRVNTPGYVYLDFHDCQELVTVVATLSSLPNRENEHDRFQIDNEQHQRKPVKITLEPTSGSIERSAQGNPVLRAELAINYCFGANCGEPWSVIPPVQILLNSTHGYVVMTTNRPAYRPGETVDISLALTNQDLKPELERRPLKILIKTPEDKGRIIVHDSEEKFVDPDGFLEHEYQIPPDPMEGVWWAEAHVDGVKMAEKSFVIDRYELPTFHVQIIPKYHFVLDTLTHIEGKLTAEYSYGEKVDGSYYMSFRLIRGDGSEKEFYKIPQRFGREAMISRGAENYRVPMRNLTRILKEDESFEDLIESGARIAILASVTGYTEGVFESDVVENIIFTHSPFIIDHSQSAKFHIPGTIYALKATVLDAQSKLPLPEIPVKITWQQGARRRSTRSDENGEVYHEIDNFREPLEEVLITTDSEDFNDVDQSQVTLQVRQYRSKRTLGVRVREQVADIGEDQHITFDVGNEHPTDIRFFVVARGEVVFADTKVLEQGQQQELSAFFPVQASMVPHARVVAYYILGGELTSNSAWFDVTNKCETELQITPLEETVAPGATVRIELNGAPEAKVFVSAVDRAAYFVHNGTRNNRPRLWSKMEEYDTGCSRKGGLDAINVFEEAGLSFNSPLTQNQVFSNMYCRNSRKKRDVVPNAEQDLQSKLDGCLNDGGREDLRELSCDRRSELVAELLEDEEKSEFSSDCIAKFMFSCGSPAETSLLGRAAVKAQEKFNQVRIRKRENFAESWLFQQRILRANGRDIIQTRATDSITYYDIDAYGMSHDSPLCVAETKSVKVFSNFFIQLYLPYSVKVQEMTEIRYSVFNYGRQAEEVNIFMRHSLDLCSKYQSEDGLKYLTTLSVDPNSARTSSFTVLPLRVPEGKKATIEIRAGDLDYIERKLLIEEEGQHNESSQTIVLKAEEDGAATQKMITFDIPKNSVMPGTKKCFIYAYAHPMGPSIEINPFDGKLQNMDQYIHEPLGCGEQNMIRIGPIVYIHKYRVEVSKNGVSVEQQRQVVAYIQKAYNIELKWRSKAEPKAFAIWDHKPPSTWLNAFVTKVFAAAREFWPAMDTKPICDALGWLVTTQNNGYFNKHYKVHHTEMRGLVEDKISLTAYVSISLVEAASTCPDMSSALQESANKANAYLKANEQNTIQSPYTLAMGAYALAISEPGGRSAVHWNELLMARKEQDGEYIFWRGGRGRASNIETTAYALLAELALHGILPENDELTRNVAHWLISQRNSQGGFISTQDTVVALQALSTYMAVLEKSGTSAPPPTDLTVRIQSNDQDFSWDEASIQLSPDNTMRRTMVALDPELVASAGAITVRVQGIGTGSLAYRCTWRQYSDDGQCQFRVEASVKDDNPPRERVKIMRVFVSKPEGSPALISIIDVGILSGYVPDKETIDRLCSDKVVDASADRYEITENTVKFYLRKIDSGGVKLAFRINEVAKVQNRQPAAVSAYDYYEPDIRCTKFYTAGGDYQIRTTNCGNDGDRNEEFCKCAEGDCPICRTRQDQLTNTTCSSHRTNGRRRNLCKQAHLCKARECFNLHRKTCDSAYAYIVEVTRVGEDDSGFKYFDGRVEEVIRETARHQGAEGTEVRFLIRRDCFDACRDERLREIARQNGRPPVHYIAEGRTLLVYGSHPTKDDRQDPPRYVYELSKGGMEITISKKKCNKLLSRRGASQDRLNVCKIKSVLKSAHISGCD